MLKLYFKRFVDTGEMCETFPYRARALFAFEEIDGVDVCFFGMHVQVHKKLNYIPFKLTLF